jgi:voltage-gated potassium channel
VDGTEGGKNSLPKAAVWPAQRRGPWVEGPGVEGPGVEGPGVEGPGVEGPGVEPGSAAIARGASPLLDIRLWRREPYVSKVRKGKVRLMADGRLVAICNAIHDKFTAHRHSALLAAMILAFAVRPLIGGGGAGFIVFSAALLVLVLIALYNINVADLIGEREILLVQRSRRRFIGWMLIGAAFMERLAAAFARSHTFDLAGSLGWLLLLSFVTWSTLRGVLKQKAITSETISMSISVYLLLGFTWSFLYAVIFLLQPGAFSIAGLTAPIPGHPADTQPLLPTLGYFSLITLSTVGYGDITPLTMQARFAAAAEGITGQFYLAILVARLVGMQMSQSSSPPPN